MTYEFREPTPEEMDHCIWSDLHKDVYGFRPRYEAPWNNQEEFQAEMNRLQEQLRENEKLEAVRIRRVFRDWKNRVQNNARALNISNQEYIRWEMQGAGHWDFEEYIWNEFNTCGKIMTTLVRIFGFMPQQQRA